jgi:CRISPR-associated protein Csm1
MLGRDDDGVPSGGRPMIGALKADVDRLGELMRLGFGGDASLGRLAGLSRTLDLFFKGYLDRRIASRYPHVYTVYAGGDDLMLIGPWFDLMRLALDLRSRLDDASCHNPSITLSAGLVVAGANTPIRSLAAAADRALDAAKEAANGARDRFCVFSSVLSWAVARDALAASRDLLTCVDEGSLPPSRLYRLLRHGRAAEAAAHAVASGRSVPIDQLSWRSKLSYDLRRLRDASAALDAVRARLQRRDFIESGGLAVAASTALYRLRTHKEIFA